MDPKSPSCLLTFAPGWAGIAHSVLPDSLAVGRKAALGRPGCGCCLFRVGL